MASRTWVLRLQVIARKKCTRAYGMPSVTKIIHSLERATDTLGHPTAVGRPKRYNVSFSRASYSYV